MRRNRDRIGKKSESSWYLNVYKGYRVVKKKANAALRGKEKG